MRDRLRCPSIQTLVSGGLPCNEFEEVGQRWTSIHHVRERIKAYRRIELVSSRVEVLVIQGMHQSRKKDWQLEEPSSLHRQCKTFEGLAADEVESGSHQHRYLRALVTFQFLSSQVV